MALGAGTRQQLNLGRFPSGGDSESGSVWRLFRWRRWSGVPGRGDSVGRSTEICENVA